MVFVANHLSHMDTPRSCARCRDGYGRAPQWRPPLITSTTSATSPCPHRSRLAPCGSTATAAPAWAWPGRPLDRLIADGGSLLVFADGTRSRDGRVGRLRSGAALLAAEHDLPIYVSGTGQAMPRGHYWMVFKAGRPGPRHPLETRFGKPIVARPGERPSEVMERVRLFLAGWGAQTSRQARPEHAHRRQPA